MALSSAVEAEGNRFIHAPSFRLMLPEVILLRGFGKVPPRSVKFNRRNIYLRDNFTCQYCGTKPPKEELTIDHVVPRARGGRSTWDNVVLACQGCNARKGSRPLEQLSMKLKKAPKRPNWTSIVRHSMKRHNRPIWQKFVDTAYWNADLQQD
jgi:5-methylcytosine-specific restriction endonuclease McrA